MDIGYGAKFICGEMLEELYISVNIFISFSLFTSVKIIYTYSFKSVTILCEMGHPRKLKRLIKRGPSTM